MQKLIENEKVLHLIYHSVSIPSLGDLTPELIKELQIKSPQDLFYAIDMIRRLWSDNKFSNFSHVDESID